MWREHKKLWKQRAVAVFVVAGLLLNLFLLLRSEYSRQSWSRRYPVIAAYTMRSKGWSRHRQKAI